MGATDAGDPKKRECGIDPSDLPEGETHPATDAASPSPIPEVTADDSIDREIAEALLKAFREGWAAGAALHPTWFPEETGIAMRSRISDALASRAEDSRIPWMHPATLVATFRRRGCLAWQDGKGWDAAPARWEDGRAMVLRWFEYGVAVPDDFGEEPRPEGEWRLD